MLLHLWLHVSDEMDVSLCIVQVLCSDGRTHCRWEAFTVIDSPHNNMVGNPRGGFQVHESATWRKARHVLAHLSCSLCQSESAQRSDCRMSNVMVALHDQSSCWHSCFCPAYAFYAAAGSFRPLTMLLSKWRFACFEQVFCDNVEVRCRLFEAHPQQVTCFNSPAIMLMIFSTSSLTMGAFHY